MNVYRCRVRRARGLRLEGPGLRLDAGDAAPGPPEEEVLLGIRPHGVQPPTGGAGPAPDATGVIVEPDAGVEPGDSMAVRLPRRRLHFFDPRDGTRLEAPPP